MQISKLLERECNYHAPFASRAAKDRLILWKRNYEMDTEFELEWQKSKSKELTGRILALTVFSFCFANVLDFSTLFIFLTCHELSRVELHRNDLKENNKKKVSARFELVRIQVIRSKLHYFCLLTYFQHVLADAWVARMQDLGVNDTQYHCRTHLGHLLKTGDTALGYELPCS